ncbi:MAG: hypothetical protein H6577_14935 [Lewinellaceae bacterium]|nr:hypothetical protein [Saprospiraceae bacterium]MCB9339422.1 hypothetical protein [Lewinellaceae bacterium]
MKNSIAYCLFLMALPMYGQDSLAISKNFKFAEGVYLSFAELRANKPSYPLDSLALQYFTNPQTSLTQVESIVHKNTGKPLEMAHIWAICLEGIPYIHLPPSEVNREFPTFAALKLRGKICYFTYPDWRVKKVYIAAYNPLTGKPFREGLVEREEEVFVEKILHFETGEILDFNVINLLKWIQDDKPLVETIVELPVEDRKEKLFKCLLIYVDRNLAYLK